MSNLLENLNREQLEAVTNVSGPLLIVAGAGTGKTTVITRRIAYLVQQKLAKPEEILALTFTEKAAGEMEDRTLQLLPIGNYDLWISTFHGFCERVLKQHAIHIGLPYEFKLLNESQQWMLIYRNFERFNLDYYRPVATPHRFVDALLKHFSKCKDELIKPEDYISYAEELKLNGGLVELLPDEEKIQEIKRINELAEAYHVYQRLLLENDALDFGDLINYTLELFRKRPNVLTYYQKMFKYMCVDEFQDTNYAQYELVKLLTSGNKNLAVVGDDDQSIYKFRGASVSNILHFKEDFSSLSQVTLVENYRSSQEILDLAYNFIKHNDPNRLEVSLGINKRLSSNSLEKAEIKILEARDLASEINLVINKIWEIKKAHSEYSWNDFAILIRSNSAADEIIPRLEASEIPYTYVANTGLYKKPLIQTLVSYLKLLDSYHESSSLYRVITLPKFRLLPEEMSKITYFATKKTLSLYEALKNEELRTSLLPESVVRIDSLVTEISHHSREVHDRAASEIFAFIVKDLGIAEMVEPETLENAQNRELLDQFYKIIEGYESDTGDRSLKGFLDNLDLELRAGNEGVIKFDPNSGPESLKVLTIHASKGLEFENVFIVNMVDQRFPTRAKSDVIEIPEKLIKDILPEGDFHLQEERRLFYVAVTRAKRRLYFSWAKDYGGAREKKPSVFLVESGMLPSTEIFKSTGKVVFSEKKAPLAKREIVYKNLPTKFSFTDLSTFQRCPLEYKYKNYLKLPLPGAPQLSFGITIHKVFQNYLEIYLREKNNQQTDLFGAVGAIEFPDFGTLNKLYEDNWVDEWYASKKQKQDYFERGKEMLNIFFKTTEEKKPEPKYLEKAFKLNIGGFEFVGKIDRADLTPQGLSIVDYKTGKSPKGKNKESIDQLKVYQWAAEEFLNEKVANLCYWYLEENKFKEEPIISGEEMLKFQEQILGKIHEVRESVTYDTFAELHMKAPEHNCQFEGFE